MKLRLTLLILLIGACLMQAGANNVRITDKVKVAGRLGQDTIILTFPLKWDNSWRLDDNWDAVYLFIKYKRLEVEEPWRHLCIKTDGHRVDPGYTWSVAETKDHCAMVKPESSPVGLFVFRNSTGAGTASTMVRVAVNIRQGDLEPYYKASYEDFKSGKLDISVAAIEMVFVPRGPYYLGDGISYDSFADDEASPYLVTNEDSLTLRVKDGITQKLKTEQAGLRKLYPKGYDGFYCMKYEISQEQYVYFLNKLPYREQKKRIGNDLDQLKDRDYVFGDRTYPDARNGIILLKRKTAGLDVTGNHGDTAVIFGHNLNQDDGIENSPRDGKTIACNFLTPEDAKAYADWTGLRLMTELEYEKVCRLRNPENRPSGFQYAWNGSTLYQLNGGLQTGTEGTVYEVAAGNANANAGGKFNGPVRCGSFARENTTYMSVTGASYWGAMDLTGNLSEMVCNAISGRKMVGIEGDGSLASEVISWEKDTIINWYGSVGVPPYTERIWVIREFGTEYRDRWGKQIVIRDTFWVGTQISDKSYSQWYNVWHHITLPSPAWPDTLSAYGVRGGSYRDTERDYLAVSARKEFELFQNGVNVNPALTKSQRLPYVTFRLVKGVPAQQVKAGRIGLQNDDFRDIIIACSDVPYVIKDLSDGSTEVAVLYEWEEDQGAGWQKMIGETGKTLSLTTHWNTDTVLHSRQYRRKSVTPLGEGYSNTVTVTLSGLPQFKPLQSMIGNCNRTISMTGSIKVKADSILWYRADNHAALGVKVTDAASSVYTPTRTEFPDPGSYEVVCKAYLNGCPVEGKAYTNVQEPAGTGDCPAIVRDAEGNEYKAAILADCRCWMLEPLKIQGNASLASPDGIMMYNWEDVAYEPCSYNQEKLSSSLCPEGFFIPTAAEVVNLIENMNGTSATEVIKGPKPYGYLDEFGDLVPERYYWAVIYNDLLENQVYYPMACSLMTINESGLVDLIGVPDEYNSLKDNEIPDINNNPTPANGYMYFPVRCIKAVSAN